MFNQQFIKKAINFIIFIVVFTILFVLFFSTLSYTGPFVFAIFIAIITRPFTSFLKRKLRFSSSIAAMVSTLLVFAILFLLAIALFFKITIEAKTLLNSMPKVESVVKYFENLLSEIKVYYEQIDPSLTQKFTEEISSVSRTVIGITTDVAKTLISTAIGLPVVLMVIFIAFLATYFFSKDLLRMEIKFTSIFSPKGKENVIAVWRESGKMVLGYFKSYSIVVSLTFLESFIGFSVLNVKYALILSIACALLDVLPIIGISAVYLPLTIIYLSMGKYATAIGLLVLLTAVTIIRQIIEPKLYASTLGLHPAAVLVAIFIGIKAYGFLGMLYLLCVMVLYKILRKVKVL